MRQEDVALTDEEMAAIEDDGLTDEEMAAIEDVEGTEMLSMEGLKQGALKALPAAGSIIGGVSGAALGPAGAMGGAGLGAAAGKSLEELIRLGMGEKPPSREEYYSGLAEEAALGAAGEVAGPALSTIKSAVSPLAKKAFTKTTSALTRIPEKSISTYIEKTPQVQEKISQYGTDFMASADEFKSTLASDIKNFESTQNQAISEVLNASKARVDLTPLREKLRTELSYTNQVLQPETYREIADTLKKIDSVVSESGSGLTGRGDGLVDLKTSELIRNMLKESAEYVEPGMKRQGGKLGAVYANSERLLRNINRSAEPQLSKPYLELAKLRQAQNTLNKNLLKPGMPEQGVFTAGAGTNLRNRSSLDRLGKITGKDYVGEAEVLSASREFADPSLLPERSMNAAMSPLAVAGLGGLAAGTKGLALGALGSPMATKAMIDATNLAKKSIPRDPGQMLSTLVKSGTIVNDEPKLDNKFPISMTVPVQNPQEMIMLEKDLQKSDMTPSEKANRLQLLRNHGRVYIGK